jgi:hypothetical protein
METMLALMGKDWRTYRAAVIGTVVLGVGPYLLYTLAALVTRPQYGRGDWIVTAAPVSLGAVAIIAGAFGGMAWAAERTDRSATFLALLPPTPLLQAVSKLVVAGGWLVACFMADACVGLVTWTLLGTDTLGRNPVDQFLPVVAHVASYGFAVFGVAWASSAVLSSSAISAAIGIVAGFAIALAMSLVPSEDQRELLWFIASLSAGVLGLVVGVAVQVRRVSP